MYSKIEEKYGLLNHAIEVIDRMVDEVKDEFKAKSLNLYISKVGDYLGIIRTKPIYEKALEILKDKVAKKSLIFLGICQFWPKIRFP